MSKTNLLKEAIADAKTVRETAIANAKIALEEAFTPKLQSMLSKKIQEEMEGDEVEDEDADFTAQTENDDFDGVSDDTEELDLDEILREMGYEGEDDELQEEDETEDEFMSEQDDDMEFELEEDDDMEFELEEEDGDEFELDLESIIRELEDETEDDFIEEDDDMEFELEEDDDMEFELDEDEIPGVGYEDPTNADDASLEEDDDLDLDEILREMGYDDEDDIVGEEDEMDDEEQMRAEARVRNYTYKLAEAYKTIKSLKRTINEVNLLNAKLLYSNKLFRGYELTTEQKRKVIDTIDRTSNLREVKLVFSTLAESFKMNTTNSVPKRRKNILESLASKPVRSTAPKNQIIKESDELALRFQKLANIKNKEK
jgi:hypothetical protein